MAAFTIVDRMTSLSPRVYIRCVYVISVGARLPARHCRIVSVCPPAGPRFRTTRQKTNLFSTQYRS